MAKERPVDRARESKFQPLPEAVGHRTDTAKGLQIEILHAYARLSRSWLARVQSEAALWVSLGAKVASSRSLSEIVEAQQRCVSHQIQMAAEDGQQLFDDCQKITHHICELARSTASAGDVKKHAP